MIDKKLFSVMLFVPAFYGCLVDGHGQDDSIIEGDDDNGALEVVGGLELTVTLSPENAPLSCYYAYSEGGCGGLCLDGGAQGVPIDCTLTANPLLGEGWYEVAPDTWYLFDLDSGAPIKAGYDGVEYYAYFPSPYVLFYGDDIMMPNVDVEWRVVPGSGSNTVLESEPPATLCAEEYSDCQVSCYWDDYSPQCFQSCDDELSGCMGA